MEFRSIKPGARATLCVLLLLIAAGACFTLANRGLPLVRNSLVYARASENIAARGYDPRPVVADSALSYDKPILYWRRSHWIMLGAAAGLVLGLAIGICGSMLLFRGSNMAPAYGVILGAPLGLLAGAAFGACKRT